MQVIDAIVTCYTEAMVEHHETTKFPPVRGMAPTADPMASPSPTWRTTCPGSTGKEEVDDRLQLLGQHFRGRPRRW